MDHEHLFRLLLEAAEPFDQPVFVRMTAHAHQLFNLRPYLNGLTEKLHLVDSVHKQSAQRSHRLIPHKQNGTFRSPEVMLQMMPDTSGIAHSGSGNDDFRRLVKVDFPGFLAGNGKL